MSDNHSSHGTPSDRSLPPVEAPNARLIVQLFLVPLVLVLLVIGLIVLLFGGLGAGPQTPQDFLQGLNNPSEIKRWKTAQDLAQVLPRKPELRNDVLFALDMAQLLDRARTKPPPALVENDKTVVSNPNEVPDLLEYLPAAVGSFRVPVGLPILQDIATTTAEKQKDPGNRVRFRNAIFAIGLLGSQLKEFDDLPEEEKQAILDKLKAVPSSDAQRKKWAELAHEHLSDRSKAGPGKEVKDVFNLVPTLTLGARSLDEMSRKFTILALANWRLPGVDQLLVQMTLGNDDLMDYENEDHERGKREIRYNAALALARRGSRFTPWNTVRETLDEQRLNALYAADNHAAPVSRLVFVSLTSLREGRKANPRLFEQQPEVLAAVQQLTQSRNVAIQVEAQRFLSGSVDEIVQPGHFSRQVLLMAGMAIGVFVLLGLAIFKRWKRVEAPTLNP